jgi:hypothetical protein
VLPFREADFVDPDDVAMVQIGGRLRFGVKAFDLRFAGELASEDHLQSHQPIEADLPGLVNHPHAAAGDFAEQLIIAETVNFGPGYWRR